MASLLSSLVDNLDEQVYKINCEYRHDNKKCETSGIKYKNVSYYYANISIAIGITKNV